MRLLIEVSTIYAIYLFGTSLLIWRYGGKDRAPNIVVAWVVPVIVVASFIEFIFHALFRKALSIRPCPIGLDEAELIVERHRQQMFGGKPIEPHFASDWARLYASAVEQETEKVQKFARKVLSFA